MRSIFYHISRLPTVLSAFFDETDRAFQKFTHHIEAPLQHTDAVKLPPLCATIKEGTRLHPFIEITMPRVSPSRSGRLINGVHVPLSYRVGINALINQRGRSVFGADADIFQPRR